MLRLGMGKGLVKGSPDIRMEKSKGDSLSMHVCTENAAGNSRDVTGRTQLRPMMPTGMPRVAYNMSIPH